jgi:hypothetical protein
MVSASVNVPWCTMGQEATCQVAYFPLMSLLRHISLAAEWFALSEESYAIRCITSRWQHGHSLQLDKEGHSHLVNVWIGRTFDATHSLTTWILQGRWPGRESGTLSYPVLSLWEVTSSWPTVLSEMIHTQTWYSSSVWWCRVVIGSHRLIYEICVQKVHSSTGHLLSPFSQVSSGFPMRWEWSRIKLTICPLRPLILSAATKTLNFQVSPTYQNC